MVLRKLTMLSVVATLVLGLWALPPAAGQEEREMVTAREVWMELEKRYPQNVTPARLWGEPILVRVCVDRNANAECIEFSERLHYRAPISEFLDSEITRRAVAKAITIALKENDHEFGELGEAFPDTDNLAIRRMRGENIMGGFLDGYFRPNTSLQVWQWELILDRLP